MHGYTSIYSKKYMKIRCFSVTVLCFNQFSTIFMWDLNLLYLIIINDKILF